MDDEEISVRVRPNEDDDEEILVLIPDKHWKQSDIADYVKKAIEIVCGLPDDYDSVH